MVKMFRFAQPVDSTGTLTTDSGVIIQGKPDTHPANGAPRLSPNTPNTRPRIASTSRGVCVETRLDLLRGQAPRGHGACYGGYLGRGREGLSRHFDCV